MTRSSFVAVGLSLFVSVLAAQDRGAVPATTFAVDRFTIAVFPIEDLTGEAQGPDLASGIYEELIERLSAVEGLYVLGDESTRGFIETSSSPVQIAHYLGAASVISGEIYVAEEGYYASLRHMDAQNGSGASTYGLIASFEASSDERFRPHIRGLVDSIHRDLYPHPPANSEQARAKNRAIVLDTSLADHERQNALQGLTPPPGPFGRYFSGDAVPNDVVVAAVQLAMESADADMRRRTWRAMRRVEDPYIIEPLLAVLKNDLDEHVRVEAARALGNFVDDPEVLQSLTDSSAQDESELVREAASFATLSDSEQLQSYAETVLDESKEDSVRWRALYNLRWSTDDEEWLRSDVLAAALDLARNATTGETRLFVWSVIGSDPTGAVKATLLEALANDPDPRVRAEIVQYLRKYRNEPDVVASLESALSGETSPYVRKRLEETLASAKRQ